MGAETTYYAKVLRAVTSEEWVQVSAVTGTEAGEKALLAPGVVRVDEVLHWSDYEDEADRK